MDRLDVLTGCAGALEKQLMESDGKVSREEMAEGHYPLQ